MNRSLGRQPLNRSISNRMSLLSQRAVTKISYRVEEVAKSSPSSRKTMWLPIMRLLKLSSSRSRRTQSVSSLSKRIRLGTSPLATTARETLR